MGIDAHRQQLRNTPPGRSREKHGTFDGPVCLVGTVRNGWGFQCGCGYRSPLYDTEALAKQAMSDHAAAGPAKQRRWGILGKPKWPGWPDERRHRDFT
jgi:hypothetical protein